MSQFDKSNLRAARLTSDKVMEMRTLYAEGMTQRGLGERFGISTVQVGRIVRGESWRGSMSTRHGRDPNLLVSPEALELSAQRMLYEQELYNARAATTVKVVSPLDGAEAPPDVEAAEDIIKRKAREYGALGGL